MIWLGRIRVSGISFGILGRRLVGGFQWGMPGLWTGTQMENWYLYISVLSSYFVNVLRNIDAYTCLYGRNSGSNCWIYIASSS